MLGALRVELFCVKTCLPNICRQSPDQSAQFDQDLRCSLTEATNLKGLWKYHALLAIPTTPLLHTHFPQQGFPWLTIWQLLASNPCSRPLKIKGKVPECGTQNFRSKIHCKATVIIKNKFKLILTLSIRTFANVFSQYVSRFFLFFFVFFCQRE